MLPPNSDNGDLVSGGLLGEAVIQTSSIRDPSISSSPCSFSTGPISIPAISSTTVAALADESSPDEDEEP